MILPVIENDTQYENALERIYTLMQKKIKPNSTAYDELDALSFTGKGIRTDTLPNSYSINLFQF